MKVGILTLPLHVNYGGNLQAYALMTILKGMGHDAWLIDRSRNVLSLSRKAKIVIRDSIKKYLLSQRDVEVGGVIRQREELKIAGRNADKFIERYIQPRTRRFESTRELRRGINGFGFDAIVVGSDQVWRPGYAPNIYDYFLGFYSGNAKRISYAASFGTDVWGFSKRKTRRCGSLLRNFDAVSVREKSAVISCRDRFGVEAVHLIDPTLLLPPEHYRNLCEPHEQLTEKDALTTYMLADNAKKRAIVEGLEKKLKLKRVDANGGCSDRNTRFSMVVPSVESWLRCFVEAKCVCIDSFHGCIFAILFKKPFLVIRNEVLGAARIESLLAQFGLESRLIGEDEQGPADLMQAEINWDLVHRRIEDLKQEALNYLDSNLSELSTN